MSEAPFRIAWTPTAKRALSRLPEKVAAAAELAAQGAPPPPPRPVTGNERAFTAMIRTAMFRRVELAARDRWEELGALEAATAGLAEPPLEVLMDGDAWDDALAGYWDDHDEILADGEARGPALFRLVKGPTTWTATQVIHDPDGDHDWRITAEVDLAASDAAGSAIVRATAFDRLDA